MYKYINISISFRIIGSNHQESAESIVILTVFKFPPKRSGDTIVLCHYANRQTN